MRASPVGALARWRTLMASDAKLLRSWTPLREAACWEQAGEDALAHGWADAAAEDFARAREVLKAAGARVEAMPLDPLHLPPMRRRTAPLVPSW